MSPRELALVVMAVLGLAGCGGPAAGIATPAPSPVQNGSLTVDGAARTYVVFRPVSLDKNQLAPLVVAMHGYTVDGKWMEETTHFDDLAARAGFVVAYPNGSGQSWNAGGCCGQAQQSNIDDVKFIRQLIDRLILDHQVDPKRVFVTGMSNGGMMAYRLGCELSERIAAIASVSGALVVTRPCRPSRPISVLEMHGTNDSIVPFAGGETPGLGTKPSTISSMRQWASLDGCGPNPTTTQSGIVTTSSWSGCREASRVVLEAIKGGEHSWFGPGADPALAEPDATQVTWEFFTATSTRS